MNILVTGSRFRPAVDVRNVLDRYEDEITELVVGDSTGADEAARSWASDHGIPVRVFHAGPGHDHTADFSDDALSEKPMLCLAFPVTGSAGTISCISAAKSAGIPVTVIPEFDNEPEREADDRVVYATEADRLLLRLTMRNLVDRYDQAIASSRGADIVPSKNIRANPGLHYGGGPKPVVFGTDGGRDPISGMVMGAWSRVARMDSVGTGSKRLARNRYRAVSDAIKGCDGADYRYCCLEEQVEDMAFTLASLPILEPCSVRTGVIVASSMLEAYGRAVSAATSGFSAAVSALADGDTGLMTSLLLRR